MSKVKLGFSALFMLILLSMISAVAFAEDGVPPTSTNPAPGIHVGDVDNFGNQNTHKTHGNFQNNTNSCANCHSTHNGQDEMLLMKSGEKELCMSCHDGTMGFYDVTTASGAGTFDDSHLSSSMHDVDSGLALKAAPGALNNKETATFECSSCHNPHGSANDRLLKETVIGTTPFAFNPTTKVTVPVGTKTINLALTEDPDFAAINAATGTSGLKITESIGPKDTLDKQYYSQFCGACHDDYLAKRSSGRPSNVVKTDTHDYLYSHTTNSTSTGRNCAACHYAHGTDVTTMVDALGNKVADYTKSVADGGKGWDQAKAESYMKDVSAAGSSLKKYTNMSVCFACHATSITNQIDPTLIGPDGRFIGRGKIR
jgi:predicted CXXCH cytochrome family protein